MTLSGSWTGSVYGSPWVAALAVFYLLRCWTRIAERQMQQHRTAGVSTWLIEKTLHVAFPRNSIRMTVVLHDASGPRAAGAYDDDSGDAGRAVARPPQTPEDWGELFDGLVVEPWRNYVWRPMMTSWNNFTVANANRGYVVDADVFWGLYESQVGDIKKLLANVRKMGPLWVYAHVYPQHLYDVMRANKGNQNKAKLEIFKMVDTEAAIMEQRYRRFAAQDGNYEYIRSRGNRDLQTRLGDLHRWLHQAMRHLTLDIVWGKNVLVYNPSTGTGHDWDKAYSETRFGEEIGKQPDVWLLLFRIIDGLDWFTSVVERDALEDKMGSTGEINRAGKILVRPHHTYIRPTTSNRLL